jgi:general secretion pathway protein F
MPFIVTPRQFTQRAELYHQLGQLTSAGLGLVRALEEVKQNPPARSFHEPLQQMLDKLDQGRTFAEAMQYAAWLPPFDIALLEAGERSGRLDACFRLLNDYYNDRAQITRQVIGNLVYPVCVFHLAVFIFPFAQFFLSGNLLGYLGKTFGVLIPTYAMVAAVTYSLQGKHGEKWRARMESLLRPVPLLGTARHYLALSRLAAALEALISAGVRIIEAWDLAAAACGSPALRRAVQTWKPQVTAGQTPSEVVRACPQFPQPFVNLYSTGEISGKLDDSLRQLHRYYHEEGTRKLQAFAQWIPRLIYLLVALMVGYLVIRFWTNYFKQISNITGGF